MDNEDRKVIEHIIDELDIGMEILKNKKPDEELKKEILDRALSLTEINIGEGVKKLSPALREQTKDIPWKAIAGMRDLAAHKYSILSSDIIEDTVKYDFPQFKEELVKLLSKK
ncbi:MAG: DUF86 domain-containing protein [Bacillota bacterium]|nr:DUF86 domain-containing protein [Bacillota bacterium]